MLTELLSRSQVTLPKNIINELGLNKGDLLDITIKDGGVFICPVAVCPKQYLEELRRETEEAIQKISAGEFPACETMEALIAKLEQAA